MVNFSKLAMGVLLGCVMAAPAPAPAPSSAPSAPIEYIEKTVDKLEAILEDKLKALPNVDSVLDKLVNPDQLHQALDKFLDFVKHGLPSHSSDSSHIVSVATSLTPDHLVRADKINASDLPGNTLASGHPALPRTSMLSNDDHETTVVEARDVIEQRGHRAQMLCDVIKNLVGKDFWIEHKEYLRKTLHCE